MGPRQMQPVIMEGNQEKMDKKCKLRVMALIIAIMLLSGCGGKTDLKSKDTESVGKASQPAVTVTEEPSRLNNDTGGEIDEVQDNSESKNDPAVKNTSEEVDNEEPKDDTFSGIDASIENEQSSSESDSVIIAPDETEADYTIDDDETTIETEEESGIEEDSGSHLNMEIHTDHFSSEEDLVFSLFMTFQEAGRNLGYITQDNNPELNFNASTQTVENCYFYMDCYADFTKEEAVQSIEGYTDELIYILNNSYPELDFEFVAIFWKIPSIDEQSKYAASYYCEEKNGKLSRGDGSGLIYH